jgi:uncharacterized protein YbjT (DUF2867 family)
LRPHSTSKLNVLYNKKYSRYHWQDKRVRAATRGSSHEKLKGVELVEVDYNKPETLIPSFKDADKLFLLTPASPKAAKLATNRQ